MFGSATRSLIACLTVVALSGVIATHPALGHSSLSRATTAQAWAMPQRAPTVFGRGPEIHLLPNIGRVGTRVLAVGLGYPLGAQVSLWYGTPNAEFMPRPIACAGVSSRGIFRTSFTVTCAFVVLNTTQALHPPNRCPLSPAYRVVVVGGFVGNRFTHKQTAVEGFFVTG